MCRLREGLGFLALLLAIGGLLAVSSPKLIQIQEKDPFPQSDGPLEIYGVPVPTSQNASWFAYSDQDIGFSIAYPRGWKVYQKSGLGYSFQSPDLLTGYGGRVNQGIYVRMTLLNAATDSINSRSPDQVLLNWFDGHFADLEEGRLLTEPQRTELAGYPVVTAERDTYLFGKSLMAAILLENRSLVFDCFYGPDDRTDAAQVFGGMLQTLQILH